MRKKTLLILIFLALAATGCKEDKTSPEYIAKQYLLALKNKDWETAKKYGTKELSQYIDMSKQYNDNFGVTDARNINCQIKDREKTLAVCTFCCSTDTNFTRLKLQKTATGWLVIPHNKEAPPINLNDSSTIH